MSRETFTGKGVLCVCVWGRTLLMGETASAEALRLLCRGPEAAAPGVLLPLRSSLLSSEGPPCSLSKSPRGRHLQAASVCSLTTVSLSCLQEGQTVWVIFLWKLLIVHWGWRWGLPEVLVD